MKSTRFKAAQLLPFLFFPLMVFGRIEQFNGYYYFALACASVIFFFDVFARHRFLGPSLMRQRCREVLYIFSIITFFALVGSSLEELTALGVKDLAFCLATIAPWVLVYFGFKFASALRPSYVVLLLLAEIGVIILYVGAGVSGAQAGLVGAGAGIFILCAIRPESLWSFWAGLGLIGLGAIGTQYGSRTLFVFGCAIVVVFALKRARRSGVSAPIFLAGFLGLSSLALTQIMGADFAAKLDAGLTELVPQDFDITGFGGASNLRGYETFMLLDLLSNSRAGDLAIGRGPSASLGIDVRISDNMDAFDLALLHNAFGTLLLKFGLLGLALVLLSLIWLIRFMYSISPALAGMSALGILASFLIGAGLFVATWFELYFLMGFAAATCLKRYGPREVAAMRRGAVYPA